MSKNHENHEKKNRERNDKLFGAVLLALRSCGDLDKAKVVISKLGNECEAYKAKLARAEQANGKLAADLEIEKRRCDTVQIECNAWRITANKMTDERDLVRRLLDLAKARTAFWRTCFACLAVADVVAVVAAAVIYHYFCK